MLVRMLMLVLFILGYMQSLPLPPKHPSMNLESALPMKYEKQNTLMPLPCYAKPNKSIFDPFSYQAQSFRVQLVSSTQGSTQISITSHAFVIS